MTDYREPGERREVFMDFWAFHLMFGTHPGCVYMLMPFLRERLGWSREEALWYAFINGNTQNPVTSLMLHRRGSTPAAAASMLGWYDAHVERLAWDTDRRYHRRSLRDAVTGYLRGTSGDPGAYWDRVARGGWRTMWRAATAIPTFGRLSAFSFLEYLRIMGVEFDCEDLLLEDRDGSRSHRNGLAIVTGNDHLDWHKSNPGFDGAYDADVLYHFAQAAADMRDDMRTRAHADERIPLRDVSYFTLESALCTYKSWHRPRRRYPNVYADMLHDRIAAAQQQWPEEELDVFWEARAALLPRQLRLEDNPGDPGCVPVKQDWYRTTGEVIMMDAVWPDRYANGFTAACARGDFGQREARHDH